MIETRVSSAVATVPAESLFKPFAEIAEDERSRQRIPGLAVAYGDGGAVRWSRGFGMADIERAIPASADSIFRFASVSKPITATAALRLAERGALDLDAPVQTYVPSFPRKPWPVTCRQLLCHVTGIRHYVNAENLNTRRFANLLQTLECFRDEALLFEPGTQFSYSSYGYNLLGCAIEGATGRSFMEALNEEIFLPAGMAGSRADDPRGTIHGRVTGYTKGLEGTPVLAPPVDASNRIPGGGLCGPVADLVRFGLACLNGRIVNQNTWAEMCRVQRTRAGAPCGDVKHGYFMGHGLGWLLYTDSAGREIVRYGGLQAGARAALYLLPASGVVVAAVANIQPSDLDALVRRMLDAKEQLR